MEKLQRYRLERAVQDVSSSNSKWLEDEFKALLESNKPYQSKCDYIGYSISSIDEKIRMIDEELKHLKEYKSKLKTAKDLAVTIGADVFNQYGISKIEGNGISSITVSNATTSSKLSVMVTDEQQLIDQGYYKKILDEKKITEHYHNGEYKEFLESCCKFEIIDSVTPSKLKVNKRRAVNNADINLSDAA